MTTEAWSSVLVCMSLVIAGSLSGACTAECPIGYQKADDVCRLSLQDAGSASGTMTSPTSAADAEHGATLGSSTGQPGSSSNRGAPNAGTGTAPAAGSGAIVSSGATAGRAGGQDTNGKGLAAASGTHAAQGASAAAPCQGHAGENVCDGALMYHCGPAGTAGTSETCTSSAQCQVGLRSGACGVCTPGTFHCEGVRLDACNGDGQFITTTNCESAALCNEDLGMCTAMKCAPNAVTCSSDGSSLKTCNADGSDFADQKSCDGRGCSQSLMSCNVCMPGEKMCSGTSLATCSVDGQTMNMTACPAEGECTVAGCANGACTQDQKPSGSPCTRGKCDSSGSCVACLSATDCVSSGGCVTPVCNGGVCETMNKAAGSACGSNQECNGNGQCVDKNPCMDGTFDPSKEDCDPTSLEWMNSGGACDSLCHLTARAYHVCGTGGGSCWLNSPNEYFCSLVGTCTRTCLTDLDCPTGGSCVIDNSNPIQRICITLNCQAGEQPQWYGTQGCVNGPNTIDPSTNQVYPQCVKSFMPQHMCGWVSADPTTRALWCPAENIGDCCPPTGSGGGCVKK